MADKYVMAIDQGTTSTRAMIFDHAGTVVSVGPVVAGFSTRRGGDDPDALARAAGFPLGRLYMTTQVHGSRVVEVRGDEDPAAVRAEPADALAMFNLFNGATMPNQAVLKPSTYAFTVPGTSRPPRNGQSRAAGRSRRACSATAAA